MSSEANGSMGSANSAGSALASPTPQASPPRAKRAARARRLLSLLPVLAVLLALVLLRKQLEEHTGLEILESAQAIPLSSLALALVLVVLSYLNLTGYDWMALRLYLRKSIPYRKSAPISVVAYGVSNAVGFPLFTSTPLRLRLYATAGLGTSDVVRLISFTIVSFWLGLQALGGLLLVFQGGQLARMSGLPAVGLALSGILMLALVTAYLVATLRVEKPVQFRNWQVEVPRFRVALAQIGLSSLDWLLNAAVLWVLFPKDNELAFPAFLGACLLAQMLALISHVPGGLGVFEAIMVALVSPWVVAGEAVGALLVFRVLYYLIPLGIALVTLLVIERQTIRSAAASMEQRTAPWLGLLVPKAMAIATFVAGAFLIVSGSLPSIPGRLGTLANLVPLGLIETSHLLSGVVGLALLILARGLSRRLDGAWHAAVWILGFGLVLALLRGLDWEEALISGFVLILLLVSKRHFYRRASLLSRPFSGRWLLGVGVVLAGGVWLGLIAHGNAGFSDQELWSFSLRNEVPRFLRAQVAIAVGVVVIGLLRLFRGASPVPDQPTPDQLDAVPRIVAESGVTVASMALLGDKRFLFDDAGTSFIMYGISGDSWISMGDPVGDESKFDELIWRFREQCDLYDERPVFYQIRPQFLPLYLEAGLSVIKLGETGRASLKDFSLEGGRRKDLRQSLKKAEKEALSFEIAPRQEVPQLLPRLREISDQWLQEKNASEKAFSLGSFSEAYLSQFPAALVRREGEIVAFANVLATGDKSGLTVDLMRYSTNAPPGVMDYLFVKLMLWGSQEGYDHFNLGMAPLAGLDQHALAPTWNRLGAWLFRHGEHFYNFQGLRAYKEKFSPTWEPRYLAAPDGLATSRALYDVATLISGGVMGLVRR